MSQEKIELVFLSLDIDALSLLRDNIGDENPTFRFKYLADKIEHLDQLEGYDIIVSPANSFGELKGGIDYYYYKLLGGLRLQNAVYGQLLKEHKGEIPIGQTMVFDIKKFYDSDYKLNPSLSSEFNGYVGMPKSLYMCPTMTIPMNIDGTRNAYLFTKTLIQTLTEQKVTPKRVLVPLPGIGVGQMKPKTMAKQLSVALDAHEGKGIIPAVFMTSQTEQSFREQKIYEYQPNNVLQNAKMAVIQSIK